MKSCINSRPETSFDHFFPYKGIYQRLTLKTKNFDGSDLTSELLSIYECVDISEINVNF